MCWLIPSILLPNLFHIILGRHMWHSLVIILQLGDLVLNFGGQMSTMKFIWYLLCVSINCGCEALCGLVDVVKISYLPCDVSNLSTEGYFFTCAY